jgi:hypothetical protein
MRRLVLNLDGMLKPNITIPLEPEGLGWVTHTAEIDRLRRRHAPGGELANEVRDGLGLLHRWDEWELVEIRYPSSLTNPSPGCVLAPPTFLDSTPSLVSRSGRYPGTGWGCTVNLQDMGNGSPEAVHHPIPITADFTLHEVGAPNRIQWGIVPQTVWEASSHPWIDQDEESNIEMLERLMR